MSDQVINLYNQGGYTTPVDAESVTTTYPVQGGILGAMVLRQRIQISARDVTTGTPTDVGDATNQAIRVNLVAGNVNVSASPNVTVTNWTFPGAVTITGNITANASPNVTITNWTYANAVTITGSVAISSNPTINQILGLGPSFPVVTVTGFPIVQNVGQSTTPWIVEGSWPATLSSQWPITMTFLPVTFSNPAVNVLGTPSVTFSNGTQVVTFSNGTQLVSATQGSNPWIVSGTDTILGLGPNFPVVTVTGITSGGGSSNVTVTNWTAPQTVNVTYTNGTQVVTYSAPQFAPIPATLSGGEWPSTVTFLPVTFSGPLVTVSGTATVTFSGGTQVVTFTNGTQVVTFTNGTQLVSATQGTNPWIVSSTGVGVVTFTTPAFSPVQATMTSQWPITTTFLPVTFSNPAVTVVGTPAVTFSNGTQVVTFSGSQSVTQSGNTWLVTQSGAPWLVSATQGTNPWIVSASQGSNPWTVTVTGITPVTVTGVALVSLIGTPPGNAATLVTATRGVNNAAAAVTLTNVAAQFHYITGWEIDMYAVTGTVTALAVPPTVTLSNIPGTPTLFFPSTLVTGTVFSNIQNFTLPLKSANANVSTTFQAPQMSGIIWTMHVKYYTAP